MSRALHEARTSPARAAGTIARMRAQLVAAILCLVAPAAAAQGGYWREAIEQWERPANFYALAWAERRHGAVCHAYARAAAPAARKAPGTALEANGVMPNIATTTADIAWHTYRGVDSGWYDYTAWAIVDYANNGSEQAVVYTRWKGERDLSLVRMPADANRISSLHDLLFTLSAEPRETRLEPLNLSVPIDPEAAWMTYRRTESRIIHAIFVRLLGRTYLTMHVEGAGSFSRGTPGHLQYIYSAQRLMLLVELDTAGKARALCILRARYPLLFEQW